MKLAVLMLGAMLCGCATKQGLRTIDVNDARRAVWAKPKTTFAASEPLLVHIRSYGGRKVTLELWREPNQFCGKVTCDIPAQKMYKTREPFVYDTTHRDVRLVERETVYWTSTDYVVKMQPQPPGVYELRLRADDGRSETVKFTVVVTNNL
jgi:hypothetical protein